MGEFKNFMGRLKSSITESKSAGYGATMKKIVSYLASKNLLTCDGDNSLKEK